MPGSPSWTALLSLHWVMNIPWHTEQQKLKHRGKNQKSETPGKTLKETKKKSPSKHTESRSSSMTCIYNYSMPLQLAMGARNKNPAQLWPSRVRVYETSCFLHVKKALAASAPFYPSQAVNQYRWVRCAGWCLVFLHAFPAVFCIFFRLIQLSVLIFVGEEKGRVGLDILTFLVSCPSEHHLRKERSSAESKWCSLDNSRKERHGVCETNGRAILRCDSSEWRTTASGFPIVIARLSRRDWCALPVSICSSFSFSSCGGLLFSFWRSFLHWLRMRIPCAMIDTRKLFSFWNFFTRQILEIPTDWPAKVCEKQSNFIWFFRFLLGHVNLLALPQHQHTSFLCPDVSDRIALSFFKELLNKGTVTKSSRLRNEKTERNQKQSTILEK